jgi:uncharacterized membrane protein YphA (DoxX/SURF4 family)
MTETLGATTEAQGWVARNAGSLKTLFRVVLGVVWLIDGALKFAPGFVGQFSGMITSDGQPGWLAGWFSFWANATSGNAAFWVYSTGVLEVGLGIGLVLGLLRKVAYIGGAILSLFIWAVPEGFGGPYGPGSTDIGTGAVYALLFVALMVINASYGPSRWSVDYWIEKRFPAWARFAEFRRGPPVAPHESRGQEIAGRAEA